MFDLKYYQLIKYYDQYCNDINDYSKMKDVITKETTKGVFCDLTMNIIHKYNITTKEYNGIAFDRCLRKGYFNNIPSYDTELYMKQNWGKYSLKA